MTLPYEENNAVDFTREFLHALIDPKKTVRIPKDVRREAVRLLRHYPAPYRTKQLFKAEKDLLLQTQIIDTEDARIQYGKQ